MLPEKKPNNRPFAILLVLTALLNIAIVISDLYGLNDREPTGHFGDELNSAFDVMFYSFIIIPITVIGGIRHILKFKFSGLPIISLIIILSWVFTVILLIKRFA